MKRIFAILLLVLVLAGCSAEQIYIPESFELDDRQVSFVFPDTLGGLCSIVEVSDGKCILIGSGSAEGFPFLYELLRMRQIEEISAIILQNDDPGCTGGLGMLLSNFTVRSVYAGEYMQNMDKYRLLCRRNSEEECNFYIAVEGTRILDDGDFVIDIVSSALCDGVGTLTVYVVFGDNGFLFLGSIDSKTAEDIISTVGDTVVSDVFVALNANEWTGAHKELLQRSNADFFVINAGEEAMPTLVRDIKESGAALMQPQTNGALTFVSDGKRIKSYMAR